MKNTLLSPLEFRLLAIIANGRNILTGRSIALRYKKVTRETLSFGSLYTSLRRMEVSKLVLKKKMKGSGDKRERSFHISTKGRSHLKKTRALFASLVKFEATLK